VPRLAEFELRILLTVLRCGNDAYAVAVHEDLQHRLRQRVSLGAVYVTLDRLAVKGWLSSRLGEPVAARGGRAKRHYTLTARGLALVKTECNAMQRLWSGLGVVEGQ
jgi:DNA-binding PadR family transcriptional regulator